MIFERNTILSKKVLGIFEKLSVPISINQLLARLEKIEISPNKSTLYRMMEKLVSKKVLSEITLKNGLSYYERSGKHHHHFFCLDCEGVYCLKSCHLEHDKEKLERSLPTQNFKLAFHDFNLYGHCETCESKESKTETVS